MKQTLFADGLYSLSIHGGNVKISFQTQEGQERDKVEECASIVIPVDGFANATVQMMGLLEKLEKDGIVKKGTKEPAKISNSPNFQ